MNFKTLNRIILALLFVGALLSAFQFFSGWLIIGFILGYLTFILFVSSNIQLDFFMKAYHNNRFETNNRVAITFDDGPVENTLKILEVLEKHQVKASFFCIGKNIEEHPEIFKMILEKGHFAGNHTYSHTRKMGFLSTGKIIEEIEKCDEVCKKAGGVKPLTFRPPFGIINPNIQRALGRTGHKVIGWNVRSYDAIIHSEKMILKRIINRVKAGDVILLHDTQENSVEILEQLLLFLQSNNYHPVRVDNLFKIDAYS